MLHRTHLDSKLGVPHVRLRGLVLGGQLVFVLEVSVLDVLSEPVLGEGDVLQRDRGGHPGQSFEEHVVLSLQTTEFFYVIYTQSSALKL